MTSKIREAALELGYIDARPVTGHPFGVWRDRLDSLPQRDYLSLEHDPAKVSGWPVDEITIWVAIAATPPVTGWPEDCGEIGSFYMQSKNISAREKAWESAVAGLGYEVARGIRLPERAAAIRAGFGVHGLNGPMITPEHGSFVAISLLLLHSAPPLDARGPEYDLSIGCAGCGECAKACPTGAITENGVNVMLCLRSYMNRLNDLPEKDFPKMGRRIIGCDACQLACPENAAQKRERPPEDMTEYMKIERLLADPDIAGISKYIYLDKIYVQTMAALSAANTGRTDLLPLLEAFIGNENKTLDKMARHAAARLQSAL